MKKLFLISFILISSVSYSQVNSISPFSKTDIGVYGGVNSEDGSDLWGAVHFDYVANLTEKLNIKLSAAYAVSFMNESRNVKDWGRFVLDDREYFNTREYRITKTEYKSIPITVGLQFMLLDSHFSPYILTEGGYNFIDAKNHFTAIVNRSYNSEAEIPEEYKNNPESEPLPTDSFRFGAGIGTKYKITSWISLDVRYLFYIDTEILNTHQLLVGFVF